MKLPSLAAAALLLLTTIASAQRSPAAVGIQGLWGTGGRTLLDLTAGVKGTVTGTVYIYEGLAPRLVAPVGTGSFDAKAGLTLKGEAKRPDGSTLIYAIDGKLEGERLSVSYTFDRNKGTAILTRIPAP